jgi:hypothetical protein
MISNLQPSYGPFAKRDGDRFNKLMTPEMVKTSAPARAVAPKTIAAAAKPVGPPLSNSELELVVRTFRGESTATCVKVADKIRTLSAAERAQILMRMALLKPTLKLLT